MQPSKSRSPSPDMTAPMWKIETSVPARRLSEGARRRSIINFVFAWTLRDASVLARRDPRAPGETSFRRACACAVLLGAGCLWLGTGRGSSPPVMTTLMVQFWGRSDQLVASVHQKALLCE